jgi:hypothetical protein
MSDFDIEVFKANLTETIQWCAAKVSHFNPKDSLRTLSAPREMSLIELSHEERISVVAELIQERRSKLEINHSPIDLSAGQGKLLLFYPDGSLFDGAADVASEGFFDCDNNPAWDTWVYYGLDGSGSQKDCDVNFLVSWVPSEMVSLVNNGIDVNPESCIEWASKVKRNSTRMLNAQGWLF